VSAARGTARAELDWVECKYAKERNRKPMAFLVWNDKLSVGNEALDRDHRQVVGLINELYEAILAGHGKESVAYIVDRLATGYAQHFQREEELFTNSGYPDEALHKSEHNMMLGWITDLRERIREGTAIAPSLEMMSYMKDWLFEHLIGADQKYIPYIAQSGKGGEVKSTSAPESHKKRKRVHAVAA
jgi:hemerythrin